MCTEKHEYEVTDAQKKKTDSYEPMDSQKTRGFETTGAQKTDDVYKLMGSQKTREYQTTGAQKKLMMSTS